MTIKCPHCHSSLRVGLFLTRKQQATNTFESTVDTIPPHWDGTIRRFIYSHLFRQPQPIQESGERIIVRSEIKTSKHQMLIKELKIPATENELRQLADVYIRRGESWARNTTEQQTSMGQGKHNNIKNAFLELGFLESVNATQYQLTPPGLRFLRHYLV